MLKRWIEEDNQPFALAKTDNDRFMTLVSLGALMLAVLAIAAAPLLIRLSEQEISPLATAFDRFWLTAVSLAIWHGIVEIYRFLSQPNTLENQSALPFLSRSLPGSGWIALLGVGIFFAIDLILWTWSLAQTSVANATLLANLTPLFSTFGAWLFLNQTFDWRFVMGMAIALTGTSAVVYTDFVLDLDQLIGDLAALSAALAFCVYLFILEKLQTQLSIATILFYSTVIAALVTLPFVLMSAAAIFPQSWTGWLVVIALALICQILGQGLLTQSLKGLSSAFVALFLLLDPILAAIGANIILQERLSLINWAEFAVVLLGILFSLSSDAVEKPIAVGVD